MDRTFGQKLTTPGTHRHATNLHTEALDSPHHLGTFFTLQANSNTETQNPRAGNPAIARLLGIDRTEPIVDCNQTGDD